MTAIRSFLRLLGLKTGDEQGGGGRPVPVAPKKRLQFCDGSSVPASWRGAKAYIQADTPSTPLMNRAYSECILSRIPQSVREVRELSSATTPSAKALLDSFVTRKASNNSLTGGHKLFWVNQDVFIVTAPVYTDVSLYFYLAFYPFHGFPQHVFTLYWSLVDSAPDDQILSVHIFAHSVKQALYFLEETPTRLISPEDRDDETGFFFCGLYQHVISGADRSMPASVLEPLLRVRCSQKVSLTNLFFETAECGQVLGTASGGGCVELHNCEFSTLAEAAFVHTWTKRERTSAGSLALAFRQTFSFSNNQCLIDLLRAQVIDSIEMHMLEDKFGVTHDLMDALMNSSLQRLSLSQSSFETAEDYTSFIKSLRLGTLKNLTIEKLEDDRTNGSSSLACILKNCPQLQRLRLTNCNFLECCWDEVIEILTCHPTLSTVEFVNVKIRDEDACSRHIVEIVSTNQNMQDFKIVPSCAPDDDFHRHAIAGKLKANSYRKKVHLIGRLEENIKSALVVRALSERLDPSIGFMLLRENVALMANHDPSF